MLTPSPLESCRFGLQTYRATQVGIDPTATFAEMLSAGADLAILRVPSRESNAVTQLAELGLPVIHADTLVTYACTLQDLPPTNASVPVGVEIERAQDSDRAAVAELIAVVFSGYPNHYAANPLLDPKAVVAGYAGWALSHLDGDRRVMWITRIGGRIAAIACSAFDPATRKCRGVLHAVHPEFARRGIYTALIQRTQQYFRDAGYVRLTIATQAWNTAVQRFWARSGFVLADVIDTFHVNALLDPAHGETTTAELTFNGASPGGQAAQVFTAIHALREAHRPDTDRWQHQFTALATLHTNTRYTLRARAYEFTGTPVLRMLVGMLYDPAHHLCALARSTLWQAPGCV